jgi:hypothetical protein
MNAKSEGNIETRSIDSNPRSVSRRTFVESAAAAGVGLVSLSASAEPLLKGESPSSQHSMSDRNHLAEEIKKEKIRRVMFAGPPSVTNEATVAEMDRQGNLTVLRPGTNGWVCVPGDQNIIGSVDMCLDPMGLVWMKDLMAGKPKPTNAIPGLIYMLNGATQRSFTDPFDTTSPAIPIGPHWMILWPFDAKAAGLSTMMRDAGTLVMFAGTPYAHLHICGSPWDGKEYHPGDRATWTMTYDRS